MLHARAVNTTPQGTGLKCQLNLIDLGLGGTTHIYYVNYEMLCIKLLHGLLFQKVGHIREFHESCVGFQFVKLFWNPYNVFKPSYFINFYD